MIVSVRFPMEGHKFWFIESVWKPDQLFKFPALKETSGKQQKFRQNIAEVKQTRMFSVTADAEVDIVLHYIDSRRRQCGRVVKAPDLKSIGRGFKSHSDR